MSNIRYLESMVDHHWPEMQRNFPAIEKPVIVPAATMRGLAPMYMKRYIDQDPSSYYMFIQADPLKGDASREMACRFFDDFFYNKMKMPSSYDIESEMAPTSENPDFGTMSRVEAISKEVLPADNDRAYKTFYDEQMEILRKQERVQKLGFDPDSEETIDVGDDGNVTVRNPNVSPSGRPGSRFNTDDIEDVEYTMAGQEEAPRAVAPRVTTTSVGSSQGTAVGMPKKIFFAVDFHIGPGSNALGGPGAGRIGGRRGRTLLRNSESSPETEVPEAEETDINETDWNNKVFDFLSDIRRSCQSISDLGYDTEAIMNAVEDIQSQAMNEGEEEKFNESIMSKFRDYYN